MWGGLRSRLVSYIGFNGPPQDQRAAPELAGDVNQTEAHGIPPKANVAALGQALLLLSAGFDVNRAGENGETPAYAAAYEGHTTGLEVLVKAGCDEPLELVHMALTSSSVDRRFHQDAGHYRYRRPKVPECFFGDF